LRKKSSTWLFPGIAGTPVLGPSYKTPRHACHDAPACRDQEEGDPHLLVTARHSPIGSRADLHTIQILLVITI